MERSKKIELLNQWKKGKLSRTELKEKIQVNKGGIVLIYKNRDSKEGPFYEPSKPEKLYTREELPELLKDYSAVVRLPEKDPEPE